MFLRRIIEHIKAQNWTAIVLDFVIVVVGVFIGIQVSNWNERLAFEKREQVLIRELRGEIVLNMADAQSKGDAFLVATAAARRVLDKIDRVGAHCIDDCWSIVVDLMHASQWQQVTPRWSTYDELRRDGLPSDRQIIDLVEEYKEYGFQVSLALAVEPHYRSLVRGLIPIHLQDLYWERCYSFEEAVERYLYPCPAPENLKIESDEIDEILVHPDFLPSLREWTSMSRIVGTTLTEPQKLLGEDILNHIDRDMEAQP